MQTRRLCTHLLLFTAGTFLGASSASADLIHRYSFNEAPGSTTVVDSVGGANGVARVATVDGGAGGVVPTFDGSKATLDGVGGYIDLPNALVSGLTNVSFEIWFTWTAGGTWVRVLDFGNNSVGEDPDGTLNSGTGQNYLFISANANSSTPRFAITPQSNGQENPILNSSLGALSQGVEHYLVVNYGPDGAEMFLDGTNVATGAYNTPLSALQDVNDFLGRSQWNDPFFGGTFNEFRIHDSLLSQAEVLSHKAGGPDATNLFPPKVVNLSPANRTLFANPAGGLSFTTTSTKDIATNDITVVLNGVDVSGALQISGTSTNWQVTYNGLLTNQLYAVEITVANSTGEKTVSASFDTFVESATPAIEAENFNFDGGQFISNPVISYDNQLPNTYYTRGSQLGVSNVDFVELNGATRPTVLLFEWRHDALSGAATLPQTTENTDFLRQAYSTASVPDYDLVNIVAGEWLNYTRDFGAAANYRVYLRASAAGSRTFQLDRVTGDRTQPNQTTVLLGNFNVTAGGYGYAPLVGPDGGKEMVLALSGAQTLRLTAVVANNNVNLNTIRFVPTTDPATVIGPYVQERSPAPNATDGRPDLITAKITNRETSLAAGVQLLVDGNLVTATVTPTATGAGVSYNVSPEFAPSTAHTAELRYSDTLGNGFTNQWSFTISGDVEGPLLAFTAGNAAGAQSKLRVYFSEPMDPATAGAVTNYSSSGGVTFSSAAMLGDRVVELNASGVAEGSIYTLTVNNVTDAVGNPIISNSTLKYNLSRFEQNPNGALVMEAESYHTSTPGAAGSQWENLVFEHIFAPNGFVGGGAMHTDASGNWALPQPTDVASVARLDYRVNFVQAGTYEIWIRGVGASGGDSFHIGIDGAQVGGITGIGGNWEWDNDLQGGTGTNAFAVATAGQHTINVWMREDGSRLDRLAFIPEATSPADFGFADNGAMPGPAQSGRTGDPVPPLVNISSPTAGTKLAAGADVVINAAVTDPDSASHVVEFFVNGTKVGEDNSSPYSFTVSGLTDGYYSVSAGVTDPDNLTASSPAVPIQVGNPKPRSLLVVGNPAGLTAGDTSAQERLAGLGFEVVVVDDGASQTADALLKEVVVIASSVNSGAVGSKFRGVTVPVVSWESFIQDDMLYTGPTQNTDFGTLAAQSNVVVAATHPLAGGLSGTVMVVTSPQDMGWGVPVPGATNIASIDGNPLQIVIYGFDTGAMLSDGLTTAPARRVHLFLTDNGLSVATADGLKLFDAAMSWAVNRTLTYAPQGNVQIAAPQIAGGNVTLSGTGGAAGGTYRILSSTDLTLPVAQWTPVATNTFGTGGGFTNVFTLPNDPTRFYLIVAP